MILNAAETQVTVTIFAAGFTSQHLSTGIHGPAGSIPKDGPSAGVTMASALASLT